MRIVIDMQGAQTESRFRGIGRYTLAFTQAVARNAGNHEIVLVLNGIFADTIAPIRAAFDGLLPQDNILVWHAPGPFQESEPENHQRTTVAQLLREAFIADLRPDIIHIPSLFEGYVDDAVTSIGQFDLLTPVHVTIHDLIPLLNPEQYLHNNPVYEQFYFAKKAFLQKAAGLLAISEASKQEALRFLDVAESKVINTSEAADAYFQSLTVSDNEAAALFAQLSISRPMVLYTGGADERKNLLRLIRAYASLSKPLRESHQLVFAGRMPAGEVMQLRSEAKRRGLDEQELVITGYIDDQTLVMLYNLCKVFVFPSWHEGFGLPALEAMSCGAAVIGANTTSLPEVIGLAEALFDPYSEKSIADKIAQVLSDEGFRQQLISHGKQQAKKFSWDDSAKKAIASFERLSAQTSLFSSSDWGAILDFWQQSYPKLIQKIAETLIAENIDEIYLQALANSIAENVEVSQRFVRRGCLPDKLVWRLEGPFDSSYSLALMNRELALALNALDYKVVLHSTEGPGDFPANADFLRQNPVVAKLHQLAGTLAAENADVTSRNIYPPRVNDMRCRLNIFHNYAWEESGFPRQWVTHFNASLQGIACTSKHVEKVMIDNGVNVPLSVSGNGVDHWLAIIPDETFVVSGRAFRFLHVSSCFPRKGADVLLKAYGLAFTDKDDVSLIIKTFPNPHNDIHRWLAEAKKQYPHFPDVIIVEDDLTEAQLKALYGQCQALVAPSRAEGFGLPLAEAMLSDMPVIATAWSGQTDFCNDETAWLVDYLFEPAQSHFALFASVWAAPLLEDLAQKMREVYVSTPAIRAERVTKAKQLLMENYRWEHVALRLLDSVRHWAAIPALPKPNMGWITTWNTRCGIATYSAHLLECLPTHAVVLAAQSQSLTAMDNSNVERCWHSGEDDDLQLLAKVVADKGLDTLIVQFNYGFFNFGHFSAFLDSQLDAGKVVVVMLHATIDPEHVPHKKLVNLLPVFKRCQRLLVHTINDLNRLKALGLVDNVALFPHGIREYSPTANPNAVTEKQVINVASYGFFLPHKGLLELIDAVAMLRKQGENVRLNMVNAEYPVIESSILIAEAKQKIAQLGLADAVSLSTDFLTDEQSYSHLANADLIIFPYQNTGESASGAVRYGLAIGKPVVVTPLAIFDDVAEVTFPLPGTSAIEIANGLSILISQIRGNHAYVKEVTDKAALWRESHSYQNLSQRLYAILQALARKANDSH